MDGNFNHCLKRGGGRGGTSWSKGIITKLVVEKDVIKKLCSNSLQIYLTVINIFKSILTQL